MENFTYPLQKGSKSFHGNFHVQCNIETNSEILNRMGPCNSNSKTGAGFIERVNGNFYVPCNCKSNSISFFFSKRIHGNFHLLVIEM